MICKELEKSSFFCCKVGSIYGMLKTQGKGGLNYEGFI